MSSTQTRHRPVQKEKRSEKRSSEKDVSEKFVEQASSKWSRIFLKVLVFTIFLTVIVPLVVLFAYPSPVTPVRIEGLSEPPEFTGPLEFNDILASAQQIYKDELVGPESVVVVGDHIYTGTADGWVSRVHGGVIEKIARFGHAPCGGIENENTCGRPLGMRMDKDGFLIVIDAYHGLFKLNVSTGDYTQLQSAKQAIGGKEGKFFNDLDIAPDGKIYFTDSSTKWHRNQFLMILLEGIPNGRLLVYDPATKITTELYYGLLFANGVQLTRDKSAVLVAETFKARIMKYDLKTKQMTVWADNLPGFPDNIRYSQTTGTYWVGLAWGRRKGAFSLADFLAPLPWLRGLLAKFMTVQHLPLLRQYFGGTQPQSIAIELNETGSITRSLQDKTGRVVSSVSEVEFGNDVLYFGSYHANYLVRLAREKVPEL